MLPLKDCVKSNGKNTFTCPDAVTTGCLIPCGLHTYQYSLCYKAKTLPTLPVPSLSGILSICICRYMCVFYKTVESFGVLLHVCFPAFLVIGHLYIILYTAS